MKILKDILAKLLLLSCSMLFTLILVEIGVRYLGLFRFPPRFVEQHMELGWSHIPNKEGYWRVGKDRIHIKINSKGLRDREFGYEKEEGSFRILVLGDSFTEGFQVPLENTFCKVLERKLNETQRRFEVINCGFAGVGTDYELLFLKREGYKYHPDLVLTAFFQNDVYDNYRSKDILNNQADRVEYEKMGLATRLRRFLAENSCAYNYLGYTLPQRLPSLAKLIMKTGLMSSQPIDDEVQVGDLLHYGVCAKEYGPKWEESWKVTQFLISNLKKEADNHSSSLVLISIPFREQVYENLWNAKLSKLGSETANWDLGKPDRRLSKMLAGIGIPFLQLLPDFRKASENSELYYTGSDGHWNKNGHHLAGQLIFDWLLEEKLVPVEPAKVQS